MADGRTAEPVAIVGMAAVFPGAPDVARFWDNIERGVDATSDIPAGRWEPAFYDASSTAPDRVYCRRGAFLTSPIAFDALGFGIMPVAAESAEPDQLLALATAAAALADAGYGEPDARGKSSSGRSFPRDRAAVVLGRGGYMTAGLERYNERVRAAEQLTKNLRALVPGIGEEQLAAVRADIARQLGPFGAETAIGLVPNLAASRIANRLDLGGAAYTVDAACASSLVAVDHACRDLALHVSDLVLAGGVHLCHDPSFWSVFCQLGALSRTGRIRPFDRRADGLLIGEGVGVLVLKRLTDAERDDDRIYAVIRGTGVSSDGRGASLMTPAVDGQLAALRRAWDAAGLDPATVGLIEAHGTGTPAGDAAEIETLRRFFGAPDGAGDARAVVGSVKSMIGHTMPAAGAAGLVKAALAVYHGVLPPTLHCDEPRPELATTRFRALARAEPWPSSGAPRRAGVDAFGFGGINAHVVLEAHASATGRHARPTASAQAERVLTLAAPSVEELARALESGSDRRSGGPCRIAVFDPTHERRARAAKIVQRAEAWRGRDDIWFSPEGLLEAGGRVAFVFPGVEAAFSPRVADVARAFALPFEAPSASTDLKEVGMGIVTVGRILDAALRAIGVRPDLMAGHSIGEWSAMIASEMIPRDEVDPVIASLAPERVEVPGVVFLAVGAGVGRVLPLLGGLSSIAVSHDNCPHQLILCGREDDADTAAERLVRAGILCQKLPFRSGYHSPLFADFVAPHRRVLSRLPLLPPRVAVWSATTCEPYPRDGGAVRQLAVDHLVQPVRFRELTERLYGEGARVFLQLGTGSVASFIGDTLRGRPHLALAANVAQRPGMAQLHRLAAALWVEGHATALDELEAKLAEPPRRTVPISLDVPLVAATTALPLAPRSASEPAVVETPLGAELALAMRELSDARSEVFAALAQAAVTPDAPRDAHFEIPLSVETHPELLDHSFYRQPGGWPSVEDRYPVVPMTMLMDLMRDVAAELVPHKKPVALEGVRAARWLAVAPPVRAKIDARYDGHSHVEVTVRGYATGVVEVAPEYPPAPRAGAPLETTEPAPITAAQLYADRWMFHGPAYQGVVDVGRLGAEGIEGTLVSLAAKGGLLDNAGQLLGYWVMQSAELDRLAMPVHIARCRFFGPQPPPGEHLECTARIRELTDTQVRADVELAHGGRVWVAIEGWTDRRFDSDARVWELLRFPERNTITVVRPEGFGVLVQPWRAGASRDLLARRYLSERERAAHKEAGPRRQTSWLLERIAVKDVVRRHLWDRGAGPLFPIEIQVHDDASGRLVVAGPEGAERLAVAVAHDDGVAVARVVDGGAAGNETGSASRPSIGIDRIDQAGAGRRVVCRLDGGTVEVDVAGKGGEP